MNVVTVTLGSLVDRALDELEAAPEVGRAVVLSTGLTETSDAMQLVDAERVSVTDIVELGSELVLVLTVSDDEVPTMALVRGYNRTTPAVHPAGSVGYLNVQWPRQRIANAVVRSFARLEAFKVLPWESTVMFPSESVDSTRLVVELPAGTRAVSSVRRFGMQEVRNWEFVYLPTTDYSTGAVVVLPLATHPTEEYSVVYRKAYRWSTYPLAPDEEATIGMTEGTEDLPAAYAAAWLISGREISRSDIDRAEEWTAGEPSRGGVSAGLVRAKWQEFYRMVDEARRLEPQLTHRPFVRM